MLAYFLRILCIEIMAMSLLGASQPGPGKAPLTPTQVFTSFLDGKADVTTKDNMPEGCKKGANISWMSFIKDTSPNINHPAGSQIFSDDAQLGELLTIFLTNLNANETAKGFTVYFTKIHLIIFDQFYKYLTKIYTVFNMTHLDTLKDYLTQDMQQGLTKKTLIINHLINIIEAQSNGAIRARFPTLPANLATYAGNVLMKHDYGADLSILIENAESY